jgi:hypothetical protein
MLKKEEKSDERRPPTEITIGIKRYRKVEFRRENLYKNERIWR